MLRWSNEPVPSAKFIPREVRHDGFGDMRRMLSSSILVLIITLEIRPGETWKIKIKISLDSRLLAEIRTK
jgi:hypothetical protein